LTPFYKSYAKRSGTLLGFGSDLPNEKKNRDFDPKDFLTTIGEGRKAIKRYSFRRRKPSSRKEIPRTQFFICKRAA
jgi:hypothetical protein